MSFISKIIPSKKVLIIDIGTYKVKVAICEFKNNEAHILSYWEKKQEQSHIINGEIANIEWVARTILLCLEKTFPLININPSDVMINIPSGVLISSGKTLTYTRSDENENISMSELDYIISKAEKEALIDAKKQIAQTTGFLEVDMKLITSTITEITIDGFKVSNPLGFTGKNIVLSLLNLFIPASRYHIIHGIGSHLGKKILSIVPLEFSLPKIISHSEYAYDDVLFIDIGSTKTSLIAQKAWVLSWCQKIQIGMNDLIKIIKENSGDTTIEVITNIQDTKKYLSEKKEFLSVWQEALLISLKEILPSQLVPYKVFLSWGWDNNFMREHLMQLDLQKVWLHSLKPFVFLDLNLKEILPISSEVDIFDKTNISLLSLVLATKEIIEYKNNPVLSLLKNFLEKNEL